MNYEDRETPWLLREPPAQVQERRRSGLEAEVKQPFLQAIIPGLAFAVSLVMTGVLLRVTAPVSIVLFVVVFSLTNALFHLLLAEPRRALLTVATCCVLGWSLSRLLWWLLPGFVLPRAAIVILLCATAGAWVSTALLSVAFVLELVQRSPFMEQFGWQQFFAWLFEYALRRDEPEVRQPQPLVQVEWMDRRENGFVRMLKMFDLPGTPDQWQRIAGDVLGGETFSEPHFGKLFGGRAGYERVRDVLLDQELVEWRTLGSNTQGVKFTRKGLRLLEVLAEDSRLPHPAGATLERSPAPWTNGDERTNANER